MAELRVNVHDKEVFNLLFEDFLNMNDKVAVVLTARGARILNDHYAGVNGMLSRYKGVTAYATDYKEGDVFEGQMWCILECFNDYCWRLGADAPFTRILKRKD